PGSGHGTAPRRLAGDGPHARPESGSAADVRGGHAASDAAVRWNQVHRTTPRHSASADVRLSRPTNVAMWTIAARFAAGRNHQPRAGTWKTGVSPCLPKTPRTRPDAAAVRTAAGPRPASPGYPDASAAQSANPAPWSPDRDARHPAARAALHPPASAKQGAPP